MKTVTLVSWLLLLFFCFSIEADTCLITDEEIERKSHRYKYLIEITITEDNGLNYVAISAPAKIEDLNFQNLYLQKVFLGGEEFVAPLKTVVQNERYLSWYSISSRLIEDNYIALDYGQTCGVSLRYKVQS
jgi:hypothetical protein